MEINITIVIIVIVLVVLLVTWQMAQSENENLTNMPDPRGTYVEEPGLLYFFNDLNPAQPLVKKTAADCKNTCISNPACYGWSYDNSNSNCAFKGAGNPNVTAQGAAFKTINSGYYYDCNGCNDPRGKYKESIGLLTVGYDLPQPAGTPPASNQDSCKNLCANTSACAGWSFQNGKCSLKNGFVPRLIFPNFTDARSGMYVPCNNACYTKAGSASMPLPQSESSQAQAETIPVPMPTPTPAPTPTSAPAPVQISPQSEAEVESELIPTPPIQPSKMSSSLNGGEIAGIVIGSVVLLIIIIFMIYKFTKGTSSEEEEEEKE